MNKTTYIPITPGGSALMDLESNTEEEAWSKLLNKTAYMSYKDKQALIQRGYEIAETTE